VSHLESFEDCRLADLLGADETNELRVNAKAVRGLAAEAAEAMDPSIRKLHTQESCRMDCPATRS
jgi:hypothetical protein